MMRRTASPQRGARWGWLILLFVLLLGCTVCSGTALTVWWLGQTPSDATPIPAATSTPSPAPSPVAPSPTPSSPTPPTARSKVPFEAVVQILALDASDTPLWTGSGSIVDPRGLILTNAHTVLPTEPTDPEVAALLILMSERPDAPPQPRFYAQVVQADVDLDLAVLRIVRTMDGAEVDPSALALPVLPLGRAADLTLGDPLTILGYPGIGGNTITLTKGEVAGFTGEDPYGPRAFIKTTATLAGGNSGGAALDAQGRLVAVPTLLGAGPDTEDIVDCRVLVDTNGDGVINEQDACVPLGGFINALRPVDLALPMLEAARRGEVQVAVRPTPTPRPQGAPGDVYAAWEQPGALLEALSFDRPVPGWENANTTEHVQLEYRDGILWVLVRPEDYLHTLTSAFATDRIMLRTWARVAQPSATQDGEFGLVCGFQDIDNFYAVSVLEDGSFYVWGMRDGDYVEWHPIAPLPTEAHFTPANWNQIGLVCLGSTIGLWVNEYPIVAVQADTPPKGTAAGLLVGTFQGHDFGVGFDVLEVYEIP